MRRSDYRALVGCLLMVLSLMLVGCSRFRGITIRIEWQKPKTELKNGTPLFYKSIHVGEVTRAEISDKGCVVYARLYQQQGHLVTEGSTFLVRRNDKGQPYIEVISLKRDSPPAKEGMVFQGAESEVHVVVHEMASDWRKAVLAAVVFVVILILFVGTFLTFRIAALVICVLTGVVGALGLYPWMARLVAPLGEGVLFLYVAYSLSFLAGYVAAAILIGILAKPLRGIGVEVWAKPKEGGQ